MCTLHSLCRHRLVSIISQSDTTKCGFSKPYGLGANYIMLQELTDALDPQQSFMGPMPLSGAIMLCNVFMLFIYPWSMVEFLEYSICGHPNLFNTLCYPDHPWFLSIMLAYAFIIPSLHSSTSNDLLSFIIHLFYVLCFYICLSCFTLCLMMLHWHYKWAVVDPGFSFGRG